MNLPAHQAWRFAMILAALICSVQSGAPGSAPSDPTPDRLYVVTHIDLVPPQAAPGKTLLIQFAADTRNDPGSVRVELLQDNSRPNHFTLVTVWGDQKSFDDHLALNHTRDFRTKLQPMLGSPFDERLHRLAP